MTRDFPRLLGGPPAAYMLLLAVLAAMLLLASAGRPYDSGSRGRALLVEAPCACPSSELASKTCSSDKVTTKWASIRTTLISSCGSPFSTDKCCLLIDQQDWGDLLSCLCSSGISFFDGLGSFVQADTIFGSCQQCNGQGGARQPGAVAFPLVRQALPFGIGGGSSQGGASAQQPAGPGQSRSSSQDNKSLYQQRAS